MLYKLVLFTALAAPTPAQSNVVDEAWDRTQTDPQLRAVQPIELEACPDGGVLALTLQRGTPIDNFGALGRYSITKIDENGDEQWSDSMDAPPVPNNWFTGGRYFDAAVDSAGEIVVIWSTPSDSFLRRYDSAGVQQWTRTLDGSIGAQYVASFVEFAPSGHVVVLGSVLQGAYPRFDVRTFAPDGTPGWDWRGDGVTGFGNAGQGFPESLAIGPGGTIYAVGRNDAPAFQHGPRTTALSANGSFLWSFDFGFSQGAFGASAFDSQGNIVLVGQDFGIRVAKLTPAGSTIFSTLVQEPGFGSLPNSVVLDGLDRVWVGGVRFVTPSIVREARLYRLDSAGNFLGGVTPSVVAPGEDGAVFHLGATTNDDIVAYGYSGTGVDEMFLARFEPGGGERWAIELSGRRPLPAESGSVNIGFALDPLGNPLTLDQTIEAGVFPHLALGAKVRKFVQDGPAGLPYCGPAATNSTGVPAVLAAIGPNQLSADNVTLRADQLPPGALTLFLASQTQGSIPMAGGGQGTVCLGGMIGRFYGPGEIRTAGPDGSAAVQLHLDNLPQPSGRVAATVGETWNFQGWYRDSNPGATSNLTDGVQVILQ